MQIKKLESTDSTNTWVNQNESLLEDTALVYCVEQTAGRGQRGNSWESESGKNITASLLIHPQDFAAYRQFQLSEAMALAIVDYLRSKDVEAKVKWPNDIYVGDKKICGILVEHVVTGKNISRTIAGFGLNINQEKFLSDAPNPVSLTQLTSIEYNLETEIKEVAKFITRRFDGVAPEDLHSEFLSNLWRHDGEIHGFKDNKKGELIQARIMDVDPNGTLYLMTDSGEMRDYAFKEIEFLL